MSGRRLVLSNEEDLDRVDGVRAGCDAILVGAHTVRRDDPRLVVSERRRAERVARGVPEYPAKVVLTSGGLDPDRRFFTTGDGERFVYCPSGAVEKVRHGLAGRAAAEVIGAGDPLDLTIVLADLAARGVRRLMVEGGGVVHTEFLTRGLVDEVQLVVAPFFVGEDEAPRFVGAGRFPQDARHRMTLAEVRPIGDVVLLRYLTTRREAS